MKSLALLLFSILLNISAFAQNGVYLFGYMENAPGITFDISVVIYTSPPVTAQFTVNPDGDITNGNAYWVDLPSPDWTHFEVLYPTCNNETNILTVPADSLPNMIDVSYVIDYCPGDNEIYGCTDPEALNYAPNATVDDGSCIFDEQGCVDVNIDIFCVDTTSIEYDMVINQDPFCCDNSWDEICQNNYININGPLLENCVPDSTDIYGCTDPNAINYNSNATIDDGSCTYNDSCTATTTEILIVTDQWGEEISWNLYYEGVEIAGDGGYQGNSTYSYPLCLEDGCYTFEMYDSYGDGWNGATFSVLAEGAVVANGSLESGQFGFVDFGINSPGCDSLNSVYGCTDPLAINYDPNANVDDGSCTYETVENDLCADAIELQEGTQLINNSNAVNNENIWGECWAFGNGEGEQTSIWYSFTTPDEPATIHIEASPDGTNTLTDTQFGLFEECGGEMIYCDGNAGQGLFSAFDFACGELQPNTTYILMIDGYFGDNGTCYLTYEVESGCVPGCTDPEALNYDPTANYDDGSCVYDESCTDNEVTLLFDSPTNNSGYWQLFHNNGGFIDTGEYDDGANEWNVCLEDGCYILIVNSYSTDSIMSSSVLSILHDNQFIQTGQLTDEINYFTFGINSICDSADVYGCTDPEAINFDPNATVNDGSCEYECGDLSFEFVPFGNPPLGCVGQMVATYTGADQNGTLVWDYGAGTPPLTSNDMSGFYQYSENGEYLVCATYYTENCTLQYCDTLVTYDCNEEIYGCTNPQAINYDPNATIDDGSCIFENDSCETNEVIVVISTDSWGSEISWNIVQDNTEVAGDSGYGDNNVYTHPLCLDDGCYTFEMFDSYGDGWNGGTFSIMMEGMTLAEGTLTTGEYGTVNFSVNADCGDDDCVEVGDNYCVDINTDAYTTTIQEDAFCCTTQWDLICQNAYIENGGTVGEGCDIYGCTDPEAINYNPNATADDGSCDYPAPCTDYTLVMDGPSDAFGVFNLYDQNNSLAINGTYNGSDQYFEWCLEDGCHELIMAVSPLDSISGDVYYSIFQGSEMIEFGMFEDQTVSLTIGVNTECDPDSSYLGCTDPNAINYNPNASVDDGSCEYEFDCGISFTVSPDTTGAQVIWITPSDNIYNAVSVEWEFGDGNTSNDLFPVHTYEGDGPYMLCLTATFQDNGGFCEITYCAELTDEMINPPGMQSEGFSINVVDPLGTTGVDEIQWMSELSLWPNPTTSHAQLSYYLEEYVNVNIEIYDVAGKIVYTENIAGTIGSNVHEMDVNALSPGIYMIRLTGNENQQTMRMVKQ